MRLNFISGSICSNPVSCEHQFGQILCAILANFVQFSNALSYLKPSVASFYPCFQYQCARKASLDRVKSQTGVLEKQGCSNYRLLKAHITHMYTDTFIKLETKNLYFATAEYIENLAVGDESD